MKILVLGGDGFCGWPTALHLSHLDHEVVIVDNLSRRRIDIELGAESLTPIRSIEERLEAWREVSGQEMAFVHADVTEFDTILDLLRTERPHAIVHFAEQRAAPYSMKSPEHKNYTVRNNVNGTHSLLNAMVESSRDTHLVHLGTMGVYGYDTKSRCRCPTAIWKCASTPTMGAKSPTASSTLPTPVRYTT